MLGGEQYGVCVNPNTVTVVPCVMAAIRETAQRVCLLLDHGSVCWCRQLLHYTSSARPGAKCRPALRAQGRSAPAAEEELQWHR